jgi:hypothetical protein
MGGVGFELIIRIEIMWFYFYFNYSWNYALH